MDLGAVGRAQRLGFLLDTGASFRMVSEAVIKRWHANHPDWPMVVGQHGHPIEAQ